MVGWKGHLTVVGNVVLVGNVVKDELLVQSIEKIFQLRLLPNCIGSKNEIVLILPPVNISNGEIVVFGHLEWSAASLDLS